jgi:tight adherence protein B
MATLIVVTLAFFVGVALVMGLYAGASKLPQVLKQRQLGARLQEVAQPHAGEDSEDGEGLLVRVQHEGPLPAVDRLIGGTARGSLLTQWIAQSGVKLSPSGAILIALALALLFAFVAGVVARSSWALLAGAALGFGAPFVVLRIKRTRRLRQFEEQFPEALDLIARALKAGHAFATGLKMVADEMPEPVGPEFRKTFDEQNFGLPLKDALDNLTQRVPLIDVRFFATAVLIQRDTGGNLSEILENLAHVVRERFKILRQVRVYTAHGRFTGYVLLALPAVLCIALAFINPDHMNLLFRERMGQLMLFGALGLQTMGYLWIKQVIKIEV